MTSKEHLVQGACYSLFAFFCFALFGAFVKAAHSPLWANFISFVVGAVVLLSFFLYSKGIKHFTLPHKWLYFFRAFFGLSASILYVVSINYIPLLDATLLYNATPLFLPIFSIFLLNTKVDRITWIAILAGYIGIAFIIRPSPHSLSLWGDLLGLASGIFLALAFTFVKLQTKTEAPLKIACFYLLISSVLQLPFIPWFGPLPTVSTLLFSCAAGIALALAQISVSKSYSLAPAAKVGIFQYMSVVFIGFIDWMVWDQVPNLYDWIGTIIVILAGVLIIAKNQKPSIR